MALTLKVINSTLFILRVLLVFLPYPGYIHPDQYFQSPEAMAGDILQVKTDLTWEWSSSYPARNIVFPALSSGFMFWLAKQVKAHLNYSYTPYLLLILPRIMMLVMTVVIEKLLMLLVLQEKMKMQETCLFLFRSSHVSLIFLTTTFSNTLETLFFVLIFYQSRRLIKILKKSTDKVCCQTICIGLTTAFGFFIRPSFLAFAFYPLLHVALTFAFYNSFFNTLVVGLKLFLSFFVGLSMGTCFNVFIDTAYFSKLNMVDWVFTPLNLIKYNTNIALLQQHGLHPWSLHFGVNMILLFGPLYFYLILLLMKTVINCQVRLSTSKEFLCSVLSSTLVPVFMMSFIKHQEPRYILSVLVPLILSVVVLSLNRLNKFFIVTWLLFNIVGTFWYGFAHQGGIIPALHKIHKMQKNSTQNHYHFFFWKTYMIPKHLLALPKDDQYINIYDLAGAGVDVFLSNLQALQRSPEVNKVFLIRVVISKLTSDFFCI